jgi:hypothetical protein
MTHRKEKILQGILNNLSSHFFGYSGGLIMMADYIRKEKEATISLNLFNKRITDVKIISSKNIVIVNDYISWLKNECDIRKVPYNEIKKVTFTMTKKNSKFLFFIPTNNYTCATEIKTRDRILLKTFSAGGWI